MRKVLVTILVFSMVLAWFIPNSISFASDIDKNALEAFLGELSKIDEDTRKLATNLLKDYLDDEAEGIEKLKNDLDIFITKDHIDTIENKGYTLDDIKNELDELNSWSNADKMKLAKYIETGNTSGIRDLIKTAEKKPSEDITNTTPAGGGGSSVTAPDRKDESKVEPIEKPIKKEKLLKVNFKDIQEHRYEEDILFLAQRAIIEGKTEESFEPDGELTRAEFMALIYRVLGLESDKNKELAFEDVKSDSWYCEYVKAAFENKIIEGTSPTTFKPDDKVTREQMVAIIVRILDNKELANTLESIGKDLSMFTDGNKVSNWAKDYLFYGVKYGLLEERTETTLNPTENALRGEAANIIRKLYDILKQEGILNK